MKSKFIKNESPNPYFWSAFILSGNNDPIKFVTGSLIKNYTLLITVVILILFLVIIVQKIRKKRAAV